MYGKLSRRSRVYRALEKKVAVPAGVERADPSTVPHIPVVSSPEHPLIVSGRLGFPNPGLKRACRGTTKSR